MGRLELDRRYAESKPYTSCWARAVIHRSGGGSVRTGVKPGMSARAAVYWRLWRLDRTTTATCGGDHRTKRLLLCHVRTAEAKAARLLRARLMAAGRDYSATAVKAALLTERISPGERDRAGMVHYRGDGSVLPAIIGNYANRYLIGGHGARSGTWVGAVQKIFFACGALQVACGAL